MMKKLRIDGLLIEKGHFSSLEKARKAVMAGYIKADGRKMINPSMLVQYDARLEIKDPRDSYVSRGGLKLEKAIRFFAIDPKNKIAMDVGSSTGGFTHCLLNKDIKLVYAVDVGYGQLALSIRNDPRVVVMEKTNIRHLSTSQIEHDIDIITIDTSFISIKRFLFNLKSFLSLQGEIIALIKPQFEARSEEVGENGIIKDPMVHKKVLREIIDFAVSGDFQVKGLTFSPITGAYGNIEYFINLKGKSIYNSKIDIDKVVEEAHNEIKGDVYVRGFKRD